MYFITQNPIDIPDEVAGQLNNRIQHKLNAFTPRDQAAVRSAATTFRASPGLDVAAAITELKIGEALVSLLQPDGAPSPVARCLIRPPASRVGPLTPDERRVLVMTDAVGTKYDAAVDRESAEERLAARAAATTVGSAQATNDDAADAREKASSKAARAAEREQANSPWNQAIASATRAAGSSIGRQVANELGKQVFGSGRGKASGGLMGSIVRGVLGGLFRGR